MAKAHARKNTGRTFSKAHPGQAARSARKRLLQCWARLRRRNTAQTEQDRVDCRIVILGLSSWTDAYKGVSISVRSAFIKHFGSDKVAALDCFRVESDLNHVSFERTVLSNLISRGYQLEALEVEFDSGEQAKWGKCMWQKTHPSYAAPKASMRAMFPEATEHSFSFISAVFKTEHAGEQKFGLCSSQMLSIQLLGLRRQFLFHKALIFRKAVLSPPSSEDLPLAKAA